MQYCYYSGKYHTIAETTCIKTNNNNNNSIGFALLLSSSNITNNYAE